MRQATLVSKSSEGFVSQKILLPSSPFSSSFSVDPVERLYVSPEHLNQSVTFPPQIMPEKEKEEESVQKKEKIVRVSPNGHLISYEATMNSNGEGVLRAENI